MVLFIVSTLIVSAITEVMVSKEGSFFGDSREKSYTDR
jgi:hypothetical protein